MTPLAQRFETIRGRTMLLAEGLSAEDCCVQSMPDASPTKWHLAHTTWFFETFVLEPFETEFEAFHPAFRVLFNSYYNGVGEKFPRPQRGLLTRPSLADIQRYRTQVDARMFALMDDPVRNADPLLIARIELGLQHEQQHQELMLTDIKHLLSLNPCVPVFRAAPSLMDAQIPGTVELEFSPVTGGLVEIGHGGQGFGFDNEYPRHTTYLEDFHIANRLVTNREYLGFVRDGGYQDPAHWLSEGWDWLNTTKSVLPLYWRAAGDEFAEFTLHGLIPLDLDQPLVHVNYFEAEAYARWAGARLPTEFEWEQAALSCSVEHMACNDTYHPRVAHAAHDDYFGQVWQWTSSAYSPYPGFKPAEGAVGEYNGKFMVNQYVLRGASCATPHGHSRHTYRNFFPTSARWQFSGIRLACSA